MGWWEDITEPVKSTVTGKNSDPFQLGTLNPMNTDPIFNISHGGVNDFLTTGNIGGDLGSGWEGIKKFFNPDKPAAPGAPPKPPTIGETNMIGLGQTLSYEQRLAASATNFTGGAGLLNDQPKTASQVLLGS